MSEQKQIHPQALAMLRFFEYAHLSPRLQAVSARFAELARWIATELDGPEATVAMRKLLESKDSAVRASL